MLKMFAVGMLFCSGIAAACPAGQESRCIVPNPLGGCIQSGCFPAGNLPGEGREYTRIYVKNGCNKTINVTIAVPGINGEAGTNRALGWWTLAAGEKGYLADTHYRNFFYYGRATDGSREWKGNPCQNVMGATGNACFKYLDTGMSSFGDYTLNLTCN